MSIKLFCSAIILSTGLMGFASHGAAGVIFDGDQDADGINLLVLTSPTNARYAVQATFASDVVVRGFEWSGGYLFDNTPTGNDDFSIGIYANVGGVPANPALFDLAVSLTSREDSSANLGITDIFSYTGDISATALNAGIYWFSMTNDTSDDPNDTWSWAGGSNSVNSAVTGAGLAEWSTTSLNFDLTIFDESTVVISVPLPATLPLLLVGLASLGVTRRLSKAALI